MNGWTFKTREIAEGFDSHVREQLPWYDLATESVSCIVRHYLPRSGLIYDIGASTGNIGKALSGLIAEREATLVGIEDSEEMVSRYGGGGTCKVADACEFEFEPFDIAVAFLSMMFMPISGRRKLIRQLREKVRCGGAIVIVDKIAPPNGYPGQVMRRLTLHWKMRNGATPEEILNKELSLAGVQRPLQLDEVGSDAVEFFRLGEFVGWIIESKALS